MISNESKNDAENRRLFRFLFLLLLLFAIGCQETQESSPLIHAVSKSSLSDVSILIKNGEDVNKGDARGWTPLFYAMENNRSDLVNILLKSGADINVRTISGRTPLIHAVERSSSQIVNILINAGSDIHIRDNANQTAIALAGYAGRLEIVKLLKEAGSTKIELIETLIAASGQGHLPTVRYLISNGISTRSINRYGVSAFSVATNNRQLEVMQFLFDQERIQK